MEDVLAVYARPPDPARPLVCFDELSKELRADVRPALPAIPGEPAREDCEYARHGTANLFLVCAPLLGWRQVQGTERRTRLDFAHAIRALVDRHFPAAERIVLVLDNLNTHDPAALDQAFAPAEAKRVWDTREVHPTPTHGSWLNVAEIELSVLEGQCLDRRRPDRPTLAAEVAAWVADRNAEAVTSDWQFTTADARTKRTPRSPIPQPVI